MAKLSAYGQREVVRASKEFPGASRAPWRLRRVARQGLRGQGVRGILGGGLTRGQVGVS